MIGIDTNVLVRYLMQDDPAQTARANRFIESLSAEKPGFVTLVSVVELYWVLTSCYDLTRAQVTRALHELVRTRELVVEGSDRILRALEVFSTTRADFPDCLIARVAVHAGCERVMTFDRQAAKAAGMTILT